MEKLIISTILCLNVYFFSELGKGSIEQKRQIEPLSEIAHVLEQHHIEIKNWSVYTRNEIAPFKNERAFQAELHRIEEVAGITSWKVIKTNQQWKAEGTVEAASGHQEKVIVVNSYPHNSENHAYIIFEATGLNWNKRQWRTSSEIILSKIDSIFLKNTTIFSCVRGLTNDKIESVLYNSATSILNDLHATEMELLKEENFVSVSAYNKKWTTSIPARNGKMNVQLALRNLSMNRPTEVIIGTPIITAEY